MMTLGFAKEQIQKMIAHFSIEEQVKVIEEISAGLHKRASQHLRSEAMRTQLVRSIRGKYANVQTSSARFAQLKQQEIALEG